MLKINDITNKISPHIDIITGRSCELYQTLESKSTIKNAISKLPLFEYHVSVRFTYFNNV